jgi:poly(3-hydroxybutyrate) depolymerase
VLGAFANVFFAFQALIPCYRLRACNIATAARFRRIWFLIIGDIAMLYHTYELTHAALSPLKALSQAASYTCSSVYNPLSYTPMGKSFSAACEVFNRTTKRYDKPQWGLNETVMNGKAVPISDHTVYCTPFCDLLHFKRESDTVLPKVLVVAPISGHYPTLLRGTVEAMLPEHDVYVTDWRDARMVPASLGPWGLADCIDTIANMIRFLGQDVHVIAVCQPSVPVLAAVALMAEDNDPCQPASMILMGGPIDTRVNPTAVNRHAETKDISWFRSNVVSRVPFPHPGMMRQVYPGFIQLTGFMTMNLNRHMKAHLELFNDLVRGDGDSADQHKEFYDEYLSVMDLPAEFYLETVKTVFKDHSLPKGEMTYRGRLIRPSCIQKTALMTVEGAKDDICGLGQTAAAHDLCAELPEPKKLRYVNQNVGHYGVFNGRRWRTEIQPEIAKFIAGS